MSMTMEEKLKLFSENKYDNQVIKRSKLTDFKTLDYVYLWTNEEIKHYYAKYIDGSKVLSVTGSGDHVLHAVLGGAKEVHAFDVNEFSKYLSMLKVALIKNVSYQDFYKYMNYLNNNNFGIVLGNISKFLTTEELEFWSLYVCLFENSNESLFLYGGGCSSDNNAYIKPYLYNDLKRKLNSSEIIYHDTTAEELVQKFNNDKFSVIYLSNILGRIEKPFSEIDKEATDLLVGLENILDDKGKIYDYNLRIAKHKCYSDDRVEKLFDIKSFNVGTQRDNVYVYSKKSE